MINKPASPVGPGRARDAKAPAQNMGKISIPTNVVRMAGPKSPAQNMAKVVNPLAPSGSRSTNKSPNQTMSGVANPIGPAGSRPTPKTPTRAPSNPLQNTTGGSSQPFSAHMPAKMSKPTGPGKTDKKPKKGAALAKPDNANSPTAAGAPYVNPKAAKKQKIAVRTYHV